MATTIDQYALKIDTRDAQRSLQGFASEVGKIGGIIAGAFSVGALVNVSRSFEDMRTSLKVLYGSASEGNKVFADIQNFAKTSVFSVNDLTQTVIKLRAAGLDPTISQLRLFADVSSVATDSVGALQAITDLYARTTEGGLGLEDLNRLADRGIPVFKILGEQLGMSRLEISKFGQTAEGAQLILKALEQGLSKTFGGTSAERAKNLSQAMSNFGDTVQGLADVIGKTGMNEGLAKLITSFGQFLESIRPLAAIVGVALGGAFSFLADNIKIAGAAIVVFGTYLAAAVSLGVLKRVLGLAEGFAILNSVIGKNPLLKLAGVIVGFAAAMYASGDSIDELKKKMGEVDNELSNFGQNAGAKGLAEGTVGQGFEDLRGKVGALNEELKKFRVEMEYNTMAFAANNQATIDAIGLETSLLGLSKQQADIKRATYDLDKRAVDEVRRLQEQRAKLTKEELKQGRGGIIDEQIAKIKELNEVDKERLRVTMEENTRTARSFETGWATAFNNYVDSATNAAQQAQKIFETMTQGMEDLLFNFVKTGKFEWKNFVQSMVDTLLRSQIQQLMANVLGGGVGGGSQAGGGLLGGIGKLLGFANGGIIPTNAPVIVGERGPELLMGAAGNRVIPNDQLGGNNITYNISAVDVNSFKNMIAQDPTFLYAVTEQGRRRLPGGR